MEHTGLFFNRREFVRLLGGGVLATRRFPWQERGPDFAGLDHFEFYVSNAETSRDFFVRLFGVELLNRNNKRYLKLGSTYMAFETPRANASAGQVDHVSLAIKSLDMMKLHALLEQRGVMYQDYPSGRDTAVLDPDGTRLQLSPENGWSLLNPATFKPETIAFNGAPLLRAIALDHVVFNVTDIDKAVTHYEKVLGPIAQRSSDVAWFQTGASRIGLSRGSPGQKPGIQYICISTASFDTGRTASALQEYGVKLEPVDIRGAIRFRDPDGLSIEVLSAQR